MYSSCITKILCNFIVSKNEVLIINKKTMEDELSKLELHIERLKVAIQITQKKAEVLEIDVDERMNELLDKLSKALKQREILKQKK